MIKNPLGGQELSDFWVRATAKSQKANSDAGGTEGVIGLGYFRNFYERSGVKNSTFTGEGLPDDAVHPVNPAVLPRE